MFDAYNVKKVLPRLVVAVILIQLSWFIFTALIRLTAVVAYGLEGLMYAPFGGRDAISFSNIISNSGVSGGNGLFVSAVVIGSAFAVVLGVVFSFALTALIGLLIGFATLLIRQVVLITLLVLSPLALVAWILPGTQKFWKIWWESFSKLLLMFPMIVVLIAGGRIVAYIAAQASGVDPATSDLFSDSLVGDITFLAIITIGYFGPFFLIPKTFQLAGSAFGNITGMVNDRSRGVFDRLRKGRQERSADRIKRAGSNSLWNQKQGGFRGAFAKRANTAASWMVAPRSNLQYAARNGKVPLLSAQGRRIASGIEAQQLEQSQKLMQHWNGHGANDKFYRAVGGFYDGFTNDTKKALIRDGFATGTVDENGTVTDIKATRALQSERDFHAMAKILSTSESDSERKAATALRGNAAYTAGLYANSEMNKADTIGASALGLAAHGFYDGRDAATTYNMIRASGGSDDYAHAATVNAEFAARASHPENKPGYGHEVINGEAIDGLDPRSDRGWAVAGTLSAQDFYGMKGDVLKPDRFGGVLKDMLELSSDDPDRRNGVIDKLRAAGLEAEDIQKRVEIATKDRRSIKEALFQVAGRYSGASAGVKTQTSQLLESVGLSQEFEAYNRGVDPAIAAQGMQGPPPGPDPGADPGAMGGGAH